jgi:hypothetical protein
MKGWTYILECSDGAFNIGDMDCLLQRVDCRGGGNNSNLISKCMNCQVTLL